MGAHTSSGAADYGGVTAVLDAVRRIVHVLRVSSREAEKRVGLSGAQLFVLKKLSEAAPLSMNALAERTRTHQSSVSVVVQRLVERGYVTRARSARDGRQVELAPTPAARALLRRAPDAAQERLVEALHGLPPADRDRLAALLARVVEGVGGVGGEAPGMFFERAGGPTKSRPAKRKVSSRKTGRVRE